MKLLTVTVPCYNSAAYMRHAIDPLLTAGDEIEVLIIDDGSTDDTGKIADEYEARYPSIVRVIHQENGGHGEGINQGIRNARGLYFKTLDSDDRFDPDCLKGFLSMLREHTEEGTQADLVINDYVYDRPGKQAVYRIRYSRMFPARKLVTWQEAGRFLMSNQFMIHAICYRTEVLREMGLSLPKHVFYEDNLYIYQPLPHTRRILYDPSPLYGYFIGRADQSTSDEVILKRLDNVTMIAETMCCSYTWKEMDLQPRNLRDYMLSNICGNLCTASAQQFLSGSEKGLTLHARMFETIRSFDPELYRHIRRHPLGFAASWKNALGRKTLVFFYRLVRSFIHVE